MTKYRRVQSLEDAEHRLLLEVDHRAKNVLAIVDSVVRMSKADNVQLYAAAVQKRVQALSSTHMLLPEHGWRHVPLSEILQTQTHLFDNGNVNLDGPIFMVPAPSVQPLGLVVHELAANAAAHGSLSRKNGCLDVRWREEGEGIVLEWEERGAAQLDSAPFRGKGFGDLLLEGVLERQLVA